MLASRYLLTPSGRIRAAIPNDLPVNGPIVAEQCATAQRLLAALNAAVSTDDEFVPFRNLIVFNHEDHA